MAELSVTPKRSAKILPNLYDKTKTESRERKRNILYLIHSYLTEQKLCVAAEALETEAQLTCQYQVCDNVDLDIILQEYQSYYFTKFQKYPKVVRKTEEPAKKNVQKPRRKTSATSKATESKDKNLSQSENDDFQFEIISLTNDNSNSNLNKTINEEKLLYDFPHYSGEWREIADQIMMEFIPKNLGITWENCIGLTDTAEKLKEAVVYPRLYPDVFKHVPTWKGVLLFGPPGTGKTLLAKALASEGATLINVTSSAFVSKWRGESEKFIKVLFDVARHFAPTTIFIDEVDALASKIENCQHEASRRFKSELLTQLDGILSTETDIFVLGSTNTPWNLDASLLRRFEKRILVPLPDEKSRIDLLKHHITLPNDIEQNELQHLADLTKNFTGSDMKTLGKEVAMIVVREKIKEINFNGSNKMKMKTRKIFCRDVKQALEKIKPCVSDEDCSKYCTWNEKYGSC